MYLVCQLNPLTGGNSTPAQRMSRLRENLSD